MNMKQRDTLLSGKKNLVWSSLTKCIALMICLTILFSSTAMEGIAMAASSETLDYYQKVEQDNLKEQIEAITKSYAAYIKNYETLTKNGIGGESTIQATLDPSIASSIKMDGLKTIKAIATTMMKGSDAKYGVSVSCNDKELTTFEMYQTLGKIYYLIPDLSKAYLKLDYNNISGSTTSSDAIMKFLNSPVSDTTLNTILTKYSTIAISQLNDVDVKKDTSVTINNIKNDYTKVSVHINEKNALSISKAVIKAAKKDSQLKKLFAACGVTNKQFNSAIKTAEKEIASSQKALKSKSKKALAKDTATMDVWVDSNGKIAGRSFSFKADKTTTSMGYKTAKKDSTTAYDIWAKSGKDVFNATGSLTQESTSYNGDFKLAFNSNEINVNIKNLTYTTTDKSSFINGDFTISGKPLSGMTFNVKCTGSDEKQDISFDVVKGGKSIINVSMNTKLVPYTDFKLPCAPDKIYDLEKDMAKYMSTANLKDFLTKLKEKSDVKAIDNYIDTILSTTVSK